MSARYQINEIQIRIRSHIIFNRIIKHILPNCDSNQSNFFNPDQDLVDII